MSEYQEFTGKNVEEALRNARQAFGATGLDDLDFEILTPGSRGVLGMGAEPARIVAAPRAALGGAAPRREAAASVPLPAPPPRPDRDEGRFPDRGRDGDRGGDRGAYRGGDRDRGRGAAGDRGDRPPQGDRPTRADRPDRPPRGDRADRSDRVGPAGGRGQPAPDRPSEAAGVVARAEGSGPSRTAVRDDRGSGPRARGGPGRGRPAAGGSRPEEMGTLSDAQAELLGSRGRPSREREEIQAAEASPEALQAGKEILERLLALMGYDVQVTISTGETSKLDVHGEGEEKEGLGALIGRKGERLSAVQHLLNLMLSRQMGAWTRILVDVEDYRGRRERQLKELAERAAERVVESGKMLQLEAMPALERRWIHLALRGNAQVMTQSIGEEPNRRVVVLRREG
ncbi:hypothetical protein BH24CHL7_BH24CHL7_01330 [soil metagenome]